MPRVENTGANVDEWSERTHEGSTTHDLCKYCYKKLEKNPFALSDKLRPYGPKEPVGTDGWTGDVNHALYEEDDYKCEYCNVQLCYEDD